MTSALQESTTLLITMRKITLFPANICARNMSDGENKTKWFRFRDLLVLSWILSRNLSFIILYDCILFAGFKINNYIYVYVKCFSMLTVFTM